MAKLSFKIITVLLIGCLMSLEPCQAQKKKFNFKKGNSLLKKVKQVTEPEKKSTTGIELPATETNSDKAEPNERKLTPPDVNKEISNARAAFADNSYAEARFYIQQAIVGIELEIGYKILSAMPEDVLGTNADKSQDVVNSMGAGFTGMEVSREYPRDEGRVKAIVANSSILNGSAQIAVSSMAVHSYDDNTKVIRYNGYKAILEADDYSGYKMSIPFGQESVFMLECSSCQTEEELLKTADLFDIALYKTLLGEK